MANGNSTCAVRRIAASLDAVLYDGGEHSPPPTRGPQRLLFLTNPPMLDLSRPGDDIHLVCLTDNKAQTFWSFVAEKTSDEDLAAKARSWTYRPRDADANNSYPFTTLDGGGKAYIHHCPLPSNFDVSLIPEYGIPPYSPSAIIGNKTRRIFSTVTDALTARRKIGQNQDAFLRAFDLLRTWTLAAGLYSQDFGPLRAELLLSLLLAALPIESYSSLDAVRSFFERYHTNATLKTVTASSERGSFLLSTSTDFAPLLSEAARALADPTLLDASMQQHFEYFLSDHALFIRVTAQCWIPKKDIEFYSKFIEQLRSFLVEIRSTFCSQVRVRLWPVQVHTGDRGDSPQDLRSYLLGVNPIDSGEQQHISLAISSFTQHREFVYDPSVGQVSLNVLSDESIHQSGLRVSSSLHDTEGHSTSVLSSRETGQGAGAAPKKKLRTAGQALSRLRWDPSHNAQDYEVGYLDRFDGLKWMRIENWGKQVEEEDFIPEHRIQQFRRVADEVIIWDRGKRLDLTGQS